MCGIYFFFHGGSHIDGNKNYRLLSKRGPDQATYFNTKNYEMAFFRLAIYGKNGIQPIHYKNIRLMCNGEIYNHEDLEEYTRDIYKKDISDCEVIAHLYTRVGIEKTVSMIKGEFAFVLVDGDLVYFARDQTGIKPLYMNISNEGFEIASQCKAFQVDGIWNHVMPRSIYCFDMKRRILSDQPYFAFMYSPNLAIGKKSIYNALEHAVRLRIGQSDREIGFFLSGGIDSCTVLSIAMKFIKKPVKVFTFGFEKNAHDVINAEKMITWLKGIYGEEMIDWHLVIGDVKMGIGYIEDVIYNFETFDTTTIRAGLPMYLLSKYISENTDVKVLLSGEGSDEVFGGYLYNIYAPNDQAFRSEIIKRLNELYMFDVLRADRATACFGLEIRPPFLDINFLKTVLSYENLVRSNPTKKILREIITEHKLLPESLINIRKEAFSDAVGLSWQDAIRDEAKKNGHASTELWFMALYYKYFDSQDLVPKLWFPNQYWVNTGMESSARALPDY
jgi:asparagine synthase (glutamine-hydrolysing)